MTDWRNDPKVRKALERMHMRMDDWHPLCDAVAEATLARCIAVADEEAATYTDVMSAVVKTGSDASVLRGHAIGSRTSAERIATRLRHLRSEE